MIAPGGTGGYVLDPITVGVAFVATLLQAAIIVWLLIERRRRQAAEMESRGRLREHLRGSQGLIEDDTDSI